MSGHRRIQRIEITAIKHATEDPDKIEESLKSLLPGEFKSKVVYEKIASTGHYGNPITYYRLVLQGDEAERVFENIIAKMESTSKNLLTATLKERIQGGSILHLRFHKHYLLSKRFILWDGDESIKVTVRFRDRRSLEKTLREKKLL